MEYSGKTFLITGGPTIEYIDPVRIISNKSTGKMAIVFAEEVLKRGGKVMMVLGPTVLEPPEGAEVFRVEITREMMKVVKKLLRERKVDYFIAAAAVADFRPVKVRRKKISTREVREFTVSFVRNPKIIREVKKLSPRAVLVGFKAEFGRKKLEEKGRKLMEEAGCDIVVAHDISSGAGFGVDRIEGVILTRKKSIPFQGSKRELSRLLLRLMSEK